MISVTTFSQDCPVTPAPVASSGGLGLEDSPEVPSVNAGLVATGASAAFLADAGVGARAGTGAGAGAGVGPRATAHAAAGRERWVAAGAGAVTALGFASVTTTRFLHQFYILLEQYHH